MAKMKNKEVRFSDLPKLVTAEPVELSWASVNEPDKEYDSYSVEMKLPREEQWVKDFLKTILDYENANRRDQGVDEVELPTCFLTQNGDPRVSDDGNYWLIRMSGKTNTEQKTTKTGKVIPPLQQNKPKVYDVHGQPAPDLAIWSGDTAKVAGSLAFYYASGSYGSKLYLKDVQQIVAGPGPSNGNPFGDESAEGAGTEEHDEIPF